ncbi:unnamed protein product, partial [Ixodes hexagonus]
IKGPIVNVPIDADTTVKMLPRDVEKDQVHIKRKLIYKSVYIRGMVNKSELAPWLSFLEKSPLYRFYGIKVSRERVDKLFDSLVEPRDQNTERVEDPEDQHNPVQAALAMSLGEHTLMDDDRNILVMAPGEGRSPLSVVFDEYPEELSFPQIYLG